MQPESIKQQILDKVDPVKFWQEEFPDWDGQSNVQCPVAGDRHENSSDERPSFSISGDTGKFNCYTCGFHGTSIIGYYTDVHCAGDFRKALAKLYARYVGETIKAASLVSANRKLLDNVALQRRLLQHRGWTPDTLRRFRLGWSAAKKRVVIPIYTGAGFAVDVRLHDSIRKAELIKGKRVPMLATRKGRAGDLFPMLANPFDIKKKEVWICEGEPDAILLQQHEINAVTLTGGARQLIKMPAEIVKLFNGKHVVILEDNDATGRKTGEELAKHFCASDVASLRRMVVPQGKDATDYLVKEGGSAKLLRQALELEPYIVAPRNSAVVEIPLSEASSADYIGKTVHTPVLVNGKHRSPFNVPKKLTFQCNTDNPCDNCPAAHGPTEHYVTRDDDNLLLWLQEDPKRALKKSLGMGPRCPVELSVESYQSIEKVSLIPALSNSRSEDEGQYCQREGYFLGHGIEANRPYTAIGYPAVNPKTNESVFIITDVRSTASSLESFSLNAERVEGLRNLVGRYRPRQLLDEVAAMMAHNHTKIYDRDDLHIAVDLAFHSPRSFDFAGTRVPKGSLELLLFGDTRCGKGQVAEGLASFYDLGTTVSGETASFMGLVGGAAKVGDSFQLTWGAIPINNGRLVIIDEFSGLSNQDLGRLSRIRSEGIAELHKGGIQAHTNANTRLIWIANPRKGKPVSDFSSGARAIMDLMGAQEDVARFDLAFVVQKGEVDFDVINRVHQSITSDFDPSTLRDILLWTWSRKANHVLFTKECTDYIFATSKKLAARYPSEIPLIQPENVRFKLAKLAASVAARCFSTTDGVHIKVEKAHAACAAKFLVECYDKPAMGYRQHGAIAAEQAKLINPKKVKAWFNQPGLDKRVVILGLLESEMLSTADFEELTGHDTARARKHLAFFVRHHAIRRVGRGAYAKRAEFIKLLKEIQ